ncbi:transcription initiation factor IIB family protein [Natronomonas salina]|uniref:transcription initiation factor IIB n=1 Tax=Natronomonas salina TaxID=1710540 RepID=UPI0015B51650|nr:TFIIB-type zinc ribbon-containing protein [Natronomonas salina]QLD90802.1 transcription initiation factor IIB family protein [Natronomonas salina]
MASREIYEQTFDEDGQQTDQNTCPECSGRVTTNVHETVCEDCGLVIDDEQIDHGPEWREFDDDRTGKRRTGSPNTVARHDRGIGTEIGWDRDSNGRQLDYSTRRRLSRLRREHRRAKVGSKADNNRIAGFVDIRRIISALGLSRSVRDQACQLFRTAQDEGLLCGRSIEAMASACVYAVCRLNEQPRTFDDIATVSKLGAERIRHCYGVLNRELDLPVPLAGPTHYLPQIASELDAHSETERRARELLERADDRRVANGKKPMGAAAGALYLAGRTTGEYFDQDSVADAAGVSTVTVRERYRDLEDVPCA